MGARKCAMTNCNRLEFRASGFCLKHKDGFTISIEVNTSELPHLESEKTDGKLSHICTFEGCNKGKKGGTIFCRKHLLDVNELKLVDENKVKYDAIFSATSAFIFLALYLFIKDVQVVGEFCGGMSILMGTISTLLFIGEIMKIELR